MITLILVLFVVGHGYSFDPTASRVIGTGDRDYGTYGILQTSRNQTQYILVGDSWDGSDETRVGAFILKFQYEPDPDELYLSEFDDSISIVWSRRLPSYPYGFFEDVIETSDGCYVTVGSIRAYGSNQDTYSILLAKFDHDGNMMFTKVFYTGYIDHGRALSEAPNGDIVIVGYTQGISGEEDRFDAFMIRLDSDGSIIWKKVYNSGAEDFMEGVVVLQSTGDIFAVGKHDDDFYHNFLLLKIDGDDGSILFSKGLGGNIDEVSTAVIETNDGNIAFCGGTSSYGPGITSQIYHKFDPSDGSMIWSKSLGVDNDEAYFDHCFFLDEDQEGNLVFIGERYHNDHDVRVVFTKVTSEGELTTSRLQSKESMAEMGFGIHANHDGTYSYAGVAWKYDELFYYGTFGILNDDLDVCESYTHLSEMNSVSMPIEDVSLTVSEFTGLSELDVPEEDYLELGEDVKLDQSFCVYCVIDSNLTTTLRTQENMESICNNNGECGDEGICVCDHRYEGVTCEEYDDGWYCGYYRYDDYENVCSGIGDCVAENQCVCPSGYTETTDRCISESDDDDEDEDIEATSSAAEFATWFVPTIASLLVVTFCLVFLAVCIPVMIIMSILVVGGVITLTIPFMGGARAGSRVLPDRIRIQDEEETDESDDGDNDAVGSFMGSAGLGSGENYNIEPPPLPKVSGFDPDFETDFNNDFSTDFTFKNENGDNDHEMNVKMKDFSTQDVYFGSDGFMK